MHSLAALLFCVSVALAAAAGPQVSTKQGPIVGSSTATHNVFLGVPFAAPPTGKSRWRPPQAPANRSDVYYATTQKEHCAQAKAFDDATLVGSEDCLYLNIFVPKSAKTGAAVIIWIHGGYYQFGNGLYGTTLTNGTNTILVSLEYRLAAFGGLALNALKTRDGSTGNYGHQDQRAAIQWVHDNIASFGGSPSLVTVAGESSGAHSVCSHVGDPKSIPLFRGAIIESTYTNCQYRTLSTATSQGVTVANHIGCTGGDNAATVTCLMGKSTQDVLNGISNEYAKEDGNYFAPTLDGRDLTIQPLDAMKTKSVPILIGTNKNESGSIFGCACQTVADTISPNNPVYFYRFEATYQGRIPDHGSELTFVWHNGPLNTPEANVLAGCFKDYWIGFIQNQVPKSAGHTWPVYTTATKKFNILNYTISIGSNFNCNNGVKS